MGLAASQARFLGLTARKSNIEFQGQQINQARTALSNEVMNLYQKYNNLVVPVPPSKDSFIRTTYTMDSTYEKYQIDSFKKITSGDDAGYYNVVLKYDKETPKAYSYTAQNAIITANCDGTNFSKINMTIGTESFEYKASDPEGSTLKRVPKEDYGKYAEIETIMEQRGYPDGTVFYAYTRANGTTYFTTENTLLNTAFDKKGSDWHYNGQYTYDYEGIIKDSATINAIAALTQESSGRLSAIKVIKCEDDKDLEGYTYSITTGTEEDEKGYEDAMNQYYYSKQIYERQVETINKETAKIQNEDRSLELKLNQLDTEQKAVSTEMDSITKVIEDTIDSVFKTFNS